MTPPFPSACEVAPWLAFSGRTAPESPPLPIACPAQRQGHSSAGPVAVVLAAPVLADRQELRRPRPRRRGHGPGPTPYSTPAPALPVPAWYSRASATRHAPP